MWGSGGWLAEVVGWLRCGARTGIACLTPLRVQCTRVNAECRSTRDAQDTVTTPHIHRATAHQSHSTQHPAHTAPLTPPRTRDPANDRATAASAGRRQQLCVALLLLLPALLHVSYSVSACAADLS
jgi:hypothetical protein